MIGFCWKNESVAKQSGVRGKSLWALIILVTICISYFR